MKNQTLRILDNTHTSLDTAYVEPIDNSHLSPRNSNQKYTKRAYWIEYNKKGDARYVYATFNSDINNYCNPKRSTYHKLLFFFLRGDEKGIKISSLSKYSYTSDNITKILNKYDYIPRELKLKLESEMSILSKLEEKYKEITESVENEIKSSRKELTDYRFDVMYSKNEIAKCTSDLKLLRLFITGHAVKKRCRKSEYFNKTIGYRVLPPNADEDTQYIKDIGNKYLLETKPHAILESKELFRDIRVSSYSAKECTYKAPYENSTYYGMNEMLMSDPVATISLVLLDTK